MKKHEIEFCLLGFELAIRCVVRLLSILSLKIEPQMHSQQTNPQPIPEASNSHEPMIGNYR